MYFYRYIMPLCSVIFFTASCTAASFSDTVSTILTASSSSIVQIVLAALLGFLFSLTPCIYPMIPITIGILQTNSSSSVLQNALRALAYSCGIATTFALFGLASAFTGTLFGAYMASPYVIIPMVCLLVYFAGALLGFYEIYIPRMLQTHSKAQGGSLLAAFSFGAASGTIASPCLSPGLVLLLSIVSTSGSLFIGFALLFAFGIGLSIPLMLIGTFSSSLQMLPRAGMWMVYIKQCCGLLMIGMCFYLLKPLIMPQRNAHKGIRIAWCKNYADAHAQAVAENKRILLEVNAPYCTICSAIENKFFCEESVCSALGNCIPVQINGADTSVTAHEELKKKYNIIGAPTLILIDPKTGAEISRWGSELYDATVEEFVTQLNRH